MSYTINERTNRHIDALVKASWLSSRSHENEVIITREFDEASLRRTFNDKVDPTDKPDGKMSASFEDGGTPSQFGESPFSRGNHTIIAVDAGLVHLGDFVGGGVAFAIRGAAVCLSAGKQVVILRYNTGPLLIDHTNSIPALRYIGKRLGNEEQYLDKLDDGSFVPKDQVLADTNQIQDRFRNFVERMIQEEALGILAKGRHGLLLIDGALPAGTFDTPTTYLREMLNYAAANEIDVAAISKKTRISVGGKPLSSLFDEMPAFVGYMPLSGVMTDERARLAKLGLARRTEDISLGNEIYAARFGLGPPALTFRVDVQNSIRSTQDEVISAVFSDCQIHGCYPKPLIEAHQHSSFLFQDVQLLLADLVVRTGARPKERQSMDWLFAPIGAFGK